MPFIRLTRTYESQVLNVNIAHIRAYMLDDGQSSITFDNLYHVIKVKETQAEIAALIANAEKA